MARLNTRPSDRPSLRIATQSPRPDSTSDQENQDPVAQRMDKGKARKKDTPRRSSLPTPTSDASNDSRAQKRKRSTVTELDDEELDEDAAWFNRYFDPNQDADERRDVKKRSRALERDFQENRDDFLRNDDGKGLQVTISRANKIFKHVKQTNDATVDSRLLVNVSDLAFKKTAQLVLGDSSTGIDVDEFLSKCITYMRNGGPLDREDEDAPPSTARRRRTRNEDGDDGEDDAGEALDWEVLGRHACYPFNSRPAVPSFLLGPLSVEKKQRTQTQRRPRNAKDTNSREARPEELTKERLQQSEESGLTAICTRIRQRLAKYIGAAEQELLSAGFTEQAHQKLPACRAIMEKHHLSDTGGLSLFEVVLNRRSFGQTVENLFYVSFLIKEGSIGIANDSAGLPCIMLAETLPLKERQRKGGQKFQTVFSLDYDTWNSLNQAFDVRDFTIPHREEEQGATQIAQGGWYT